MKCFHHTSGVKKVKKVILTVATPLLRMKPPMTTTINALHKIATFPLSIYRRYSFLYACNNKGCIHMKRYCTKRERILFFFLSKT